jgi:hypothetical protein
MSFQIDVPIAKRDTAKQLVFGYANVSVTPEGKRVVDTHGDSIPPEVLEEGAYRYVIRSREGGVEHQVMGVARLVESVFLTAEKIEAMGLSAESFKGAAWWVGFKVDDPEVWESVKSGDLDGFSIGGAMTVQEG